MSTFDSTKTQLGKLLDEIVEGRIQLPDFQRGWVWDDQHIRSLLTSIARSFPIGAVMLLETGGEARFQVRPVEGVQVGSNGAVAAEQLILDGQQRLTSLTQVLKLKAPVATYDEKKRPIHVHYYFDIEQALRDTESIADAIVAVDETRQTKADFGRRVVLDLGTTDLEVARFHFPCDQILDSSEWEYALMTRSPEKFPRFIEFRKRILDAFRAYMLPVIVLKRQTSKEAVCLVFEKVNTGGVPLSVFELVTASWAAEGFNLREDWFGVGGNKGRHARLAIRPLLKDLEPTDFLQGLSLLYSYERREQDRAMGRTGKELAAVTAKREHILEMPLSGYRRWADALTTGLEHAERFLRTEGFHHPRFLPYRSQLVPLGAVMAHLGERWREPRTREKLAQWFWCGVLGELYGGAIETRFALDLQQLLAWIQTSEAPPPVTVQGAGFQPNRIDTLRSRTSAAYRGLYVLLQREGAEDFFWKTKMLDLDFEEAKVDIHHIFPKKWCEERGIGPRTYDSIVNKTAISYKANRMIGGKAPSAYLTQIQKHVHAQISDETMDGILRTHLIEPPLLRADHFESFYQTRKMALLALIARAMGKSVADSDEQVAEDERDDQDDELPF